MIDQAKKVSTSIATLIVSPQAMLIPHQARVLLADVAALLIEMAGRIETLERKNDGDQEQAHQDRPV